MNPTFLLGLRARFRVFAIAFVATFWLPTLVSLLLPKTYRATTSLVIDTRKSSRSAVHSSPPSASGLHTSDSGRHHYQRESRAHGGERPETRAKETNTRVVREEGGSRGSIEDWLAAALLEWLKVETSQSSVIHVAFTHSDPQLRPWWPMPLPGYIDTMLELRVSRPGRQRYGSTSSSRRCAPTWRHPVKAQCLSKAQGIVATDERLDVELSRLTELSTQLVKAQDQVFDLQSREQQSSGALSAAHRDRSAAGHQLQSTHPETELRFLNGEARLQSSRPQYGVTTAVQPSIGEKPDRRQRLDAECARSLRHQQARRQKPGAVGELKKAIAAQRTRCSSSRKIAGE